MNYRKLITVPIAIVMLFAAVPGFAVDVNELERRLNIVSEELDRLKNSSGGSGIAHRTSVHGYGETHFNMPEGAGAKLDQHRFVIGIHSEITNWIHLNAEIDFEHAVTENEFELGYLDFLISDALNFRTGIVLMPMGNLNEFHEPNLYFSAERPDFHSKLIPSSWQQAGAGIFGAKGDISYRFYITNAVLALDGTRKFRPDDFIRKGRTQPSNIEIGSLAISGRLEKKAPGGQAGFSLYYGNAAGDAGHASDYSAATTIVVADYKTRRGAWDYDFGVMKGWVEDTDKMNADCGFYACAGDIPQSAFGLLAQVAVHVPQLLGKNTVHDFIPFIMYQKIRPNDKQGEKNTSASNHKRNFDVLSVGLSYMPHPQVALKATWNTNYYAGEEVAGAVAGTAGTSKNQFDMAIAYQY